MFEGVGCNRDEEATRRSAQSLALTSLLGFTATCAVGAALVWQASGPVDAPIDDDDIELIELAVEVHQPTLEVPTPPAPRKIARGSEQDQSEAPQPEPEEPVEPTKLEDDPNTEVAASGGSADGDPGGDPDGDPEGSGLGECPDGQVCDGSAGPGGPLTLHHTEVEVLRRVSPEYPEMARALGLDQTRCKALVLIDERGRPQSVRVMDCPAEFHAETERALMRWRFRPARVAGEAVPAQFLLGVNYRLRP